MLAEAWLRWVVDVGVEGGMEWNSRERRFRQKERQQQEEEERQQQPQ